MLLFMYILVIHNQLVIQNQDAAPNQSVHIVGVHAFSRLPRWARAHICEEDQLAQGFTLAG